MRWIVYKPGTTSARSSDVTNKMIDLIVELRLFWSTHPNLEWNGSTQSLFANQLLENNFMNSNLNDELKIQKFVRQKTSYLEQFGFVDQSRRVTSLGEKLINTEHNDLYFPTLSNQQSAFLIGLLNIEYNGYFPYRNLITEVANSDNNRISIDHFKRNYMVGNPKTDSELLEIIRESYPIENFEEFKSLVHHQKGDSFNIHYFDIFESIQDLNKDHILIWDEIKAKGAAKFWTELKKQIFGTSSKRNLESFAINRDQESILLAFLKAKLNASVYEYFDLTKRALLATGVISTTSNYIHISETFCELVNTLGVNVSGTYNTIADIFTLPIESFETHEDTTLEEVLIRERTRSFEEYLDIHLTRQVVSDFLAEMHNNNYSNINTFFERSSNEATYAEFIVSVAFHYISNRSNCFVQSWNGQLADNNQPLRHATGSRPDAKFIVENRNYIVETTKMTGQQQTTNEVSPISNHLFQTEGNNKVAILFAPNIFDETIRQMEIQRNSNNHIYGSTFIVLSEILQSNISFDEAMMRVTNV